MFEGSPGVGYYTILATAFAAPLPLTFYLRAETRTAFAKLAVIGFGSCGVSSGLEPILWWIGHWWHRRLRDRSVRIIRERLPNASVGEGLADGSYSTNVIGMAMGEDHGLQDYIVLCKNFLYQWPPSRVAI
jgi:hypothetical protein